MNYTTLSTKEGFTVIEVMLFLALTGLMLIGVFTAIRTSINNQRYSTAVTSLQTHFQDEYNRVVNVRNDRVDTLQCSTGGVSVGGSATTPGTGACSIIGRLLRVNTKKTIVSYPVYATRDVANLSEACKASDKVALGTGCLNPVVDANQANTYTLAWDTSLKDIKPGSAAITKLSVFLYRSPLNSQINMLWAKQNTTSMGTLLSSLAAGKLQMCVDQSGWTTAPAMGVMIDADSIGSSNAISRITGGAGSVC